MSNTFRSSFQKVVRSIEHHMGEPLTVYAATRPPNGQATLDPDKRPASIRAVFRNPGKTTPMFHAGRSTSGGTSVSTRDTTVQISTATIDGLPWKLEANCYLQRDADGSIYRISNIVPDGLGWSILTLDQQGVPSIRSGLATAILDVPEIM